MTGLKCDQPCNVYHSTVRLIVHCTLYTVHQFISFRHQFQTNQHQQYGTGRVARRLQQGGPRPLRPGHLLRQEGHSLRTGGSKLQKLSGKFSVSCATAAACSVLFQFCVQVKLGELGSWFARRDISPTAAGRAVSRAYWRSVVSIVTRQECLLNLPVQCGLRIE